jgi:cytidine deaminase
MNTRNISTSFTEYHSIEELDQDDRELVIAAREAAQNAYAPYSKFRVGAAIKLESGIIIRGANVENAAFPSGICAERSVISFSASNYPSDRPVSMAVAALTEDGFTKEPVPPCGNCRQVIAEEEFRNNISIRLILSGASKILVFEKGGDLLPLQFNRNNMKLNPQ